MEKAGSNPAFDARTVEVPRRGSPRATAQIFRKETCVAVTDADIARSPACPLIVDVRRRSAPAHWQAVVKMSVTSVEAPAAEAVGDAGSNPAGSDAVAEVLFGAATVSPVPRQSQPRPVVKIAVTSSPKREVAGSNPARRSMRR